MTIYILSVRGCMSDAASFCKRNICQINSFNAKEALTLWKESKYHNEVILNKGVYTREWKAMGIGIYKNYSVVWFGHETDSKGEPLKP